MRKNTAGQHISFNAVATADGSSITTGTPVVYYTIDGGTQAVGGGITTHEGNGSWDYAPVTAETNGDHVSWVMVLTGAVNDLVNTYPVSFDPTDSQRMGMVVLPASGTLAVNPTLAAATHTGAIIPTVSTVTDGAKDATVMKTSHIAATAGVVDNVSTLTTNSDKTGYSIAGTKQTLDALNDIVATDVVSAGAITTLAGDVVTTTNVTNEVTADMVKINANAAAAVNLALSAGRITPFTVTNTAFTPTPTSFEVSTFSEATPDHHKSRIILWTTGALAADGGQITNIGASSLEAGNVRFTVTTMTEAPANGDTGILM